MHSPARLPYNLALARPLAHVYKPFFFNLLAWDLNHYSSRLSHESLSEFFNLVYLAVLPLSKKFKIHSTY